MRYGGLSYAGRCSREHVVPGPALYVASFGIFLGFEPSVVLDREVAVAVHMQRFQLAMGPLSRLNTFVSKTVKDSTCTLKDPALF